LGNFSYKSWVLRPKIDQLKKKRKKKTFPAKKQAVAELKNKKRTFWGQKMWKKLSLKTKNFQKKKKKKKKKVGIWGQTKQAGAELKKKKNWGKIDQFSKTIVAGIIFLSSIYFLAGIKKMFGWN